MATLEPGETESHSIPSLGSPKGQLRSSLLLLYVSPYIPVGGQYPDRLRTSRIYREIFFKKRFIYRKVVLSPLLCKKLGKFCDIRGTHKKAALRYRVLYAFLVALLGRHPYIIAK